MARVIIKWCLKELEQKGSWRLASWVDQSIEMVLHVERIDEYG